ncbi:MAG: Homeodomain-like domain [Chthoniobacteraceae bacterium]|nr:Homeodomain-like domain [Chthoniobacteraceae bacterium]
MPSTLTTLSCWWQWRPPPQQAQLCAAGCDLSFDEWSSAGAGMQHFWPQRCFIHLWITKFNQGGIDALASKPRPGRPRKVSWSASVICWCQCLKTLPKRASSIGPESKSTDGLKSSFKSNSATARQFVTCTNSTIICACPMLAGAPG